MVFLCRKFKIKHIFTTPYYLQWNEMNERFNGELIQMLTKMTDIQGKNWDLELLGALWA